MHSTVGRKNAQASDPRATDAGRASHQSRVFDGFMPELLTGPTLVQRQAEQGLLRRRLGVEGTAEVLSLGWLLDEPEVAFERAVRQVAGHLGLLVNVGRVFPQEGQQVATEPGDSRLHLGTGG